MKFKNYIFFSFLILLIPAMAIAHTENIDEIDGSLNPISVNQQPQISAGFAVFNTENFYANAGSIASKTEIIVLDESKSSNFHKNIVANIIIIKNKIEQIAFKPIAKASTKKNIAQKLIIIKQDEAIASPFSPLSKDGTQSIFNTNTFGSGFAPISKKTSNKANIIANIILIDNNHAALAIVSELATTSINTEVFRATSFLFSYAHNSRPPPVC